MESTIKLKAQLRWTALSQEIIAAHGRRPPKAQTGVLQGYLVALRVGGRP